MLLAIETAAELVGVALARDQEPVAGVWLRSGRRHAETLAPAIAHVLEQAGTSLADVDVVAVDVGPGLFTGLRVGIATAQGLAQGLGIGIVCATSVEVLAREAYDAGWLGPVAAVVDARRGEVFAAIADGPSSVVAPAERYHPDALVRALSCREELLVVGSGAHRYAATFAGLHVAAIREPSPRALAAVTAGKLAGGVRPMPPAEVRPVYLREADARINWVQR